MHLEDRIDELMSTIKENTQAHRKTQDGLALLVDCMKAGLLQPSNLLVGGKRTRKPKPEAAASQDLPGQQTHPALVPDVRAAEKAESIEPVDEQPAPAEPEDPKPEDPKPEAPKQEVLNPAEDAAACKAALQSVATAKGKDLARRIMFELGGGAVYLSQVPPEKFSAVIAGCRSALAGGVVSNG